MKNFLTITHNKSIQYARTTEIKHYKTHYIQLYNTIFKLLIRLLCFRVDSGFGGLKCGHFLLQVGSLYKRLVKIVVTSATEGKFEWHYIGWGFLNSPVQKMPLVLVVKNELNGLKIILFLSII